MKKALHFIAIFIVSVGIFFTACAPHKNTQASKTRVEKLKKDSIETHHRLNALNEKHALAEKKKVAIIEKKESHVLNDTSTSTLFPPATVSAAFKYGYPYATGTTWIKEMPLLKTESQNAKVYKATFLLKENKNSVIYAENGDLIETMSEIMPEQLPLNIYDAIKNRYPDVEIVAASTYKSSKINGSYMAIVKTKLHAELKELLLSDKGIFIE